ncbi:Coiled-coil domain-containing protein [Armadillidium nasatum]|uniref:Coiled-coil domain-containing protein n=1 Tax=Armadillidium nasatum TaxID=96803 RepID=A0A5N5TAY6_9CRUS|nr:Coiled-coil domain-containing protein [Armadillidium nasatum]
MGERKGVNKYYPPDYDPNRGGLNKFVGSHALRERARKLHMGILIIRFEMPYNIWCDGCENHIGMGVRYNAEKKKIGMYYSTPIYQFRMKCHLCDNHFEIKTDPANLDYVIVSGARRKEQRWDPAENEQIVTEDKNVTRKLATDAMFRLEHGVDDKDKAKEVKSIIENLEDLQNSRWKDDYSSNLALRQRFRISKKEEKTIEMKNNKLNLNIPLLPPSKDDEKLASLLQFSQTKSGVRSIEEKRNEIDAQSVFAKMKSKKVSPVAKKDIARQAIQNIVKAKQKNFATFSNDFLKTNLGIKKTSRENGESSQAIMNLEELKILEENKEQEQESIEKRASLIVSYDSSDSD